jgi:hypothetical protein
LGKVHTSPVNGNRGTQYITLQDVCERYGFAYSAWTIRDKCRRGEWPHRKLPGSKAILFDEDDLRAFDEGAELERRVLRKRGLSPGRIVRPKQAKTKAV